MADEQTPEEKGSWLNVARLVFLAAVLVAAWYVLEWLFGMRK